MPTVAVKMQLHRYLRIEERIVKLNRFLGMKRVI